MPSLMATSLRWRTHYARTKMAEKEVPLSFDFRGNLFSDIIWLGNMEGILGSVGAVGLSVQSVSGFLNLGPTLSKM